MLQFGSALSTTLCFCVLCYLAFMRVHLEVHSLAPTCGALDRLVAEFSLQLEPPPPSTPPSYSGVHLTAWLVEADPTAPVLEWDPGRYLLPELYSLAREVEPWMDVTLAPPRRLAYGSLVDPSLLLPLRSASGEPSYVIPRWASSALRGLNADWPMHAGPSDAVLAHPLPDVPLERPGQNASGSATLASSCTAPPSNPQSPAAPGDSSSLGRSLPAALQAAAQLLRALLLPAVGGASPPPKEPPCAPYNRLLCKGRSHCASHRGGESFHFIVYRAPAPISPLLYQAAWEGGEEEGGEGPAAAGAGAGALVCRHPQAQENNPNPSGATGKGCTRATPLKWFPGFGWVYILPALPPLGWERAAAQEARRAIAEHLTGTPASAATAHEQVALRSLGHLCREWEGGGGESWWVHWLLQGRMQRLQRRIPAHVASQTQAAVNALLAARRACATTSASSAASASSSAAGSSNASEHFWEEQCGFGGGGEEACRVRCLPHLSAARRLATAAAQDAMATLDGYTQPQHLLATYLPWWAPVCLPLLLALLAPIRKGCGGRRGG